MLLPLVWKRSVLTLGLGASGGYLAARAVQGASALPWGGARREMETGTCTVTIQAPPEKVYAELRKLDEMPRYFPIVQAVQELDRLRSRWRIQIGGRWLEWEREITEDRPNERMAWQSIADAPVRESGWWRLSRAPDERGTVVELSLQIAAPAAAAVVPLLTPFGVHPEQIAREGLRRFKQWVEAGEIATIEGQPHGTRSPMVKRLPHFEPGRPQWAARPAEAVRPLRTY